MDLFENMRAFVRVVETGSFSEAARRIGVAKSVVSKRIDQLEGRLGDRLLHRTTRRVGATPMGAAYYDHCLRILADVEETERAIGRNVTEPKGHLRISAPTALGTAVIGPSLCAFRARHPGVTVEVHLNDRNPHPVEEGLDLAIWDRPGEAGGLAAERLAPAPQILVAAPDYLARRGAPDNPRGLAAHDCIQNSLMPGGRRWEFVGKTGETVVVNIAPGFGTNDGMLVREAALSGTGIALLPRFLVERDLAAGALRPVLADWQPPLHWITAVYPAPRRLAAKLSFLLAHLGETFANKPTLAASAARRTAS
ncbi:MAG: LysR family transcriptional regulator [Alphaproteobacteria bacterium]|nr:LysR family transcriptional regulator [Alphaproteobacteria bacterium]